MPEPVENACTHREGEKELAVRPCARCGTFVCERCQASRAPHCTPCRRLLNARLDGRNKRLRKGVLWSLGAAIVPVLLVALTGLHLPALIILAAMLFGGIWGGVSAGGRALTATLYCIPGLLTPFGILFAVSRVDIGTGAPIQALLVPFALGAVPGLLAWLVLVKVLRRLELPTETSA